ncbi:MAG TPA: alkaline phosphatase family protein [Thermoanaerobaculia bacterium]|jgi:Flp pilus assembly protein TadD|nr:alkaline phosphatase family protein [Thermoanaerobaculia bacterium]
MRRNVLIILVPALIAIALAAALITIQPAGQARITRNGNSVTVQRGRIALRTAFGGKPCFVPIEGSNLYFKQTLAAGSKTGDAVSVPVSFLYEPPSTLPAEWPDGDWCSSLNVFVQQRLAKALQELPADALIEHNREAADRISKSLEDDLQRVHLSGTSVAARIVLPAGWQQTLPVPEIARAVRSRPPVIFIGLDGADWQLLDDYAANGTMPNLARLVREGSSGELETEQPPLSPIVWSTMMTGVSPIEHQVLDFTQFNPVTGIKEPITSTERKTPAIWNMETMAGRRVAVFGLWATYPAEPVRGLMVSDRLFPFFFTAESSPPPGAVYPASREAWARAGVTAAETAVDLAAMRRYLPDLTQADFDSLLHDPDPFSKPPSALRRMLVETEIYRHLSVDLFAAGNIPDLSIIYFEGTDTVGHIFAPFAPPKQPQVSQADYDRFHEIPAKYFAFLDQFLGDVTRVADQTHATIVIASDHGFQWKEGRLQQLASFAVATAAKWHRNQGIYLLRGPGIAPSKGHTGRGGIRQICATLLAATGLPQAEHVAGPPLSPLANTNTPAINYASHFQPFAPPAATVANSSAGADEAVAKLKSLGYIGTGESTAPRPAGAGASTRTGGSYNNEGLILKHEGRIPEAIAAFEKAMQVDPKLSSAAWNLSDLLFDKNRDLRRSDELLIRAIANGHPEAPGFAIGRAIGYQRAGHLDWSRKLLEDAVAAQPDNPELRMFRGRYRVAQNECAGALDDFVTVQRIRPDDPVAWASAGLAQICLGNRAEAMANIRHSLELDPNQPKLRQFLQQ